MKNKTTSFVPGSGQWSSVPSMAAISLRISNFLLLPLSPSAYPLCMSQFLFFCKFDPLPCVLDLSLCAVLMEPAQVVFCSPPNSPQSQIVKHCLTLDSCLCLVLLKYELKSAQEQSESTYLCQNLTGTSLSKHASMVKCSRISNYFFRRYEPNCGKMTHLTMLNHSTKFLDWVLQTDDLQNFLGICRKMFTLIF